jgi:putative endonuclease
MTNRGRTLYTGVTNNLERRVLDHKRKLVKGFTSKYNITFLVYHETWTDIRAAIAREKQIKAWTRARRIALIESVNPSWQDLSAGWYADEGTGQRQNVREEIPRVAARHSE